MVASYRSQAAKSESLGTDPVVSVPSGVVDGDLLVAVGIAGVGNTLTAPAGWTLHGSSLSNTAPLWTRTASSEPASYTFVSSAGSTNVVIVALRGWASIDAASGVSNTTGTLTVPALTSAGANRLLFSIATKLNSGTFTHPGTMSERWDSLSTTQSIVSAGADEIVGAGSTGTRAWTASISGGNGVAYMLAVAPAPAKTGTFTGGYDFTGTGFAGAAGPGEGTFTGGFDFTGTNFDGVAGPGEGSFVGGYDFTGTGFTGEAPGVSSGSFVGSYDFTGSGFTGAGGDPDFLVNVYPTEGGRRRFGGRK